jgi:hypothetical protein
MRTFKRKLASVKGYIIEGYTYGSTLRDLAITYDVSPGTIRNLLIDNGISLRSPGRRRANKENK